MLPSHRDVVGHPCERAVGIQAAHWARHGRDCLSYGRDRGTAKTVHEDRVDAVMAVGVGARHRRADCWTMRSGRRFHQVVAGGVGQGILTAGGVRTEGAGKRVAALLEMRANVWFGGSSA